MARIPQVNSKSEFSNLNDEANKSVNSKESKEATSNARLSRETKKSSLSRLVLPRFQARNSTVVLFEQLESTQIEENPAVQKVRKDLIEQDLRKQRELERKQQKIKKRNEELQNEKSKKEVDGRLVTFDCKGKLIPINSINPDDLPTGCNSIRYDSVEKARVVRDFKENPKAMEIKEIIEENQAKLEDEKSEKSIEKDSNRNSNAMSIKIPSNMSRKISELVFKAEKSRLESSQRRRYKLASIKQENSKLKAIEDMKYIQISGSNFK